MQQATQDQELILLIEEDEEGPHVPTLRDLIVEFESCLRDKDVKAEEKPGLKAAIEIIKSNYLFEG